MTENELELVGKIMREAARDELLPRFLGSQPFEKRRKTSAFDIVTSADEACEHALVEGLRRAFPAVPVVAEEGAGPEDDYLRTIAQAPAVFVVDPLDGTQNFASGLPLFGVIVACVEHGQVIGAAIHDPMRSDTAFALRDRGAWLQSAAGQRTPLRVAAAGPLAEMDAIAGTNFLPEPLRARVRANLGRLSMHYWLRCAAHEYRAAAAGHAHIVLYNRLMPWDHVAGWLLHREAGGFSAHFDGSEYLPSHTSGGLLYAPDQASWRACRDALLAP